MYAIVSDRSEEKLFESTFAEKLCDTMIHGKALLPLVASMYVLGQSHAAQDSGPQPALLPNTSRCDSRREVVTSSSASRAHTQVR